MAYLIVSDTGMLEMDGYTFVENIRRNKRTRLIPFMFLSTRGQTQDIVKGLNVGADAYMVSPFEPEELMAQVEALTR